MNVLRANGVMLAIALIAIAGYLPFAPLRLIDFRAFYCAGQAIVAHADPYREHPLHECEHDTSAPGMDHDSDEVTVPAPLPGYALALFALLSRLPFGISALGWISASIAALIATIELLRRVLGLPVPTIAVAIFLPAAIVAVPLGQTSPFVGCAIAACAYGLRFGRPRLAAVAALATSLDPAIALVLCATLMIAVPATRVVILFGTAALAALALLTLGIDTNREYAVLVLAAHAAGSIAERSQFSTTHFAWAAGMGSSAATVLGKLWFGGAACAGVWVALRLRARFGIAALALVPPAFAVFGGLYVHFSQVVLALPAFLMALRQVTRQQRWMPGAIFVLAIPWLALAAFPPFAIALVALAVAFTRDIGVPKSGLRLGLGAAALLVAFFAVALITVHPSPAIFHPALAANPLAEIGWSRYVAWRDPKPNGLFVLLQLPTVIAFGACLAGLFRMALARRERAAAIVYVA